MENIEFIEHLARDFRDLIDIACDGGCFNYHVLMRRFPYGCCGVSAELMGEYLLEKGINNLWYVCGTHRPEAEDKEESFNGIQSHAWISVGSPVSAYSIVVDISVDSVPESKKIYGCPKSVFAGKKDSFHGLFNYGETEIERFNGIDAYNDVHANQLWKLYKIITG